MNENMLGADAKTTKQKCLEFLTSRGMSTKQAEAVLEQAKPIFEADGYQVTWDRSADEYPAPFYLVAFLVLSNQAVQWIDANLPDAWFRLMFLLEAEDL